MMQLIDVPEHLSLEDKMCGSNRVYLAPEILQCHKKHDHASQISNKADVWSIGVILYTLVIGRISLQMATQETPVFDFTEPEWEAVHE